MTREPTTAKVTTEEMMLEARRQIILGCAGVWAGVPLLKWKQRPYGHYISNSHDDDKLFG
jgi:hypothetical protein